MQRKENGLEGAGDAAVKLALGGAGGADAVAPRRQHLRGGGSITSLAIENKVCLITQRMLMRAGSKPIPYPTAWSTKRMMMSQPEPEQLRRCKEKLAC